MTKNSTDSAGGSGSFSGSTGAAPAAFFATTAARHSAIVFCSASSFESVPSKLDSLYAMLALPRVCCSFIA